MSSRQEQSNARRANQESRDHRSRTQPWSNVTSIRTQPSRSSNSSRGERTPRTEKSVFTFVDGRDVRNTADGPSRLIQSVREATIGPEGRTRHSPEQHPSRRRRLLTSRERRTMTGASVRGEYGETPRLNMSNVYRRNLWAGRAGNLRRSVSREIGSLDLTDQSLSTSSSDSHQPNPNAFFSLVELESVSKKSELIRDIQKREISGMEPSESCYMRTSKMSATIKKLDDVPEWATESSNLPGPPGSPKIGTTESTISVKKTPNQLDDEKLSRSATSITYTPHKYLDPQELMKKLKEISETRRTYYVQKTGSDDDSLLDLLLQSPQRHSIGSLVSLPMNIGRDFSPSTRALAGSMATLKFIELSKRKHGSVSQNAPQTEGKGDGHKVPRMRKCETFVPPIDVYRRDLIINVPIDPLSPVETHETVDAPAVEMVIMMNQICEEIDTIFKDIHLGFYDSQERIKVEEEAAKNQQNKLFERTQLDKQLLLELKLSLLPAYQAVRRSVDSRRSVQSLGSRHSSRGSSLGDLQRTLSQPSLNSLPKEPQMDSEELIQILNEKYEKPYVDSHLDTNSDDMKIIYSSSSSHLKRQLSKKTLETVADDECDQTSERKSVLGSNSSRSSFAKGSLRRFTAKVQIPTINDMSVAGESVERKTSDNENQEEVRPARSQGSSHIRAPSRASMVSSGTIASSKFREMERRAVADLVESEFGPMQLGTIDINPNDDLEIRSQSQLNEVLATYGDPEGIDYESRDIFEGDPQLMVETGTFKQLMLHTAKRPLEAATGEYRRSSKPGYSTAKNKRSRSKKTTLIHEAPAKEQEKMDEQEDMEEKSHEECNEWVAFTSSLKEDGNKREIEEEEDPVQNQVTGLSVDPQELRLLFPFAFRLSITSSWWKRPRFDPSYRDPITKEKAPEFDDLRDQLKALLEEYQDNYSRFETVYRWGDPRDPPVWNKKYRSPFMRPNVSNNQDPNRFHLSDDALSMKDNKECEDTHNKPPGYSTATFYVEPTKWWNLASVRRYVLRKELAKHSLDRHRMRLGLRARPAKYPASLILGCRKRRTRKKGQVCRRRKDVSKTWAEMFMKRNLPRSMWKELKTKYELATSLRYRQRHHWNPFHPSNKPSIDGATRLGWYGQSLIRKNNITFLGQFARGVDEKPGPEVKAITEREVRDKWQRDIMEMAYVAYCTNKLITEELQFLVMIGFWLGVVIDEFSYFIQFVMEELGREHKKTMYEKKHTQKFKSQSTQHINPTLLDGTEKKNPKIWEKILRVCDKTLFMLRRGLLPVEQQQHPTIQKKETHPDDKYTENALSIPWYENTKLQRTNRRLLDSIALAYPDFYYLANKSNKFYHVELDADEARWFPIRFYDADTGEYNFISHDHPKWPDWKFLHMTSYGNAFQMNPITFMPYKEEARSESQADLLSDENLDGDNQIQEYRTRGSIKLTAPARGSKVSEAKKALVLMLRQECFDNEGIFRYILINPIKFDRKRVNMAFKTLEKATTQMCADPNTVGLDNIRARFLKKSKLSEKYIKLDPEALHRILKKYSAQDENPRSFTDRRIDIALDYWYGKAAQVNKLLEAISIKISAVDRIFTFLQTHHEHQQLLVFDDPNSLKFQNEPVWNRRLLDNFKHGCSGRKDCGEDEDNLISRSSQSSSCSESEETEEPQTPIDRIPSDFLKVMHTYFSLTTIETLKKQNFVEFPVPLETLYCYERMKKGTHSKQTRIPIDRLSLRGRISERHRVRVERRRELNKLRDQKNAEGGGDRGGDGDHARCMGDEDDPRTHVGFKSKCPVCHKMLISHHPSLTLYIEFKSRHIREHKTNAEGIKPPKKTGFVRLKHPQISNADVSHASRQNRNLGKIADAHEDCYLHCRVPTILSIFQGVSVNKNKQERLIRYFNRALNYEHAAVKDEITTRLNEETDELEFLKHKQNYLQELHDTICERTTCPIISQQIRALLTHEEMVMRIKKRTILSSKYCKKRTGWPLKLLSHMTRDEVTLVSKFAYQKYPYTMTTYKTSQRRKILSRRLLNDLYICWLDAYSRGTDLLSKLSPQMKTNRVYLPDNITTNFLDSIIKILRRPELPKQKEQSKISKGKSEAPKTAFDVWFEEFVESGLHPKRSSSLNIHDGEGNDILSLISSRYNLLDRSEREVLDGVRDGTHDDAVSESSRQEDHGRHQGLSSEDDSSDSHNSQGRLIDVSPSYFEIDSDVD